MFFDKRISKIISKNSGDDFVFNDEFSRYKGWIEGSFNSFDESYNHLDNFYINLAREHCYKNCEKTSKDEVVVLVHPFYPSFKDYDFISDDPMKNETYEKYMFNLDKFLKKNEKDLILFETPHHYLGFTSRLVEEGLVKNVVFTERDFGHPYSKEESDKIDFSKAYVGGAYGDACLDSAINRMELKGVDVFGIKDLSLKSPHYNNISNGVSCYLEKKKRVGLDSILK